jgi:hypothetical protein
MHAIPISSYPSGITLTILSEEYKLRSSICNFLQPPVTSFFNNKADG